MHDHSLLRRHDSEDYEVKRFSSLLRHLDSEDHDSEDHDSEDHDSEDHGHKRSYSPIDDAFNVYHCFPLLSII